MAAIVCATRFAHASAPSCNACSPDLTRQRPRSRHACWADAAAVEAERTVKAKGLQLVLVRPVVEHERGVADPPRTEALRQGDRLQAGKLREPARHRAVRFVV